MNSVKLQDYVVSRVVSRGSRPLELLSIILVSSGINLMTSAVVASSIDLGWLFASAMFTMAGGLIFSSSEQVQNCYDDAKAQQRSQLEQKEKGQNEERVDSIPVLAVSIILFEDKKRLFRKMTWALVLVAAGSVVPIYKTVGGVITRNNSGQTVPQSNEQNQSPNPTPTVPSVASSPEPSVTPSEKHSQLGRRKQQNK